MVPSGSVWFWLDSVLWRFLIWDYMTVKAKCVTPSLPCEPWMNSTSAQAGKKGPQASWECAFIIKQWSSKDARRQKGFLCFALLFQFCHSALKMEEYCKSVEASQSSRFSRKRSFLERYCAWGFSLGLQEAGVLGEETCSAQVQGESCCSETGVLQTAPRKPLPAGIPASASLSHSHN